MLVLREHGTDVPPRDSLSSSNTERKIKAITSSLLRTSTAEQVGEHLAAGCGGRVLVVHAKFCESENIHNLLIKSCYVDAFLVFQYKLYCIQTRSMSSYFSKEA